MAIRKLEVKSSPDNVDTARAKANEALCVELRPLETRIAANRTFNAKLQQLGILAIGNSCDPQK